MSIEIIAILLAAFGLTALLLANLLFFTRWAWWIKGVAVVAVGLLFQGTWSALPHLLGWPTARGLPERFNLSALEIVEPDKSGQNKGAIYLWVTDLNLDDSPRTPRAFVVPFHPELQAKLATAGTKLRKNMPQVGEVVETPFESGPTSTHGQQPINLDFFDLPDPLYPEGAPR
ncbi:MAG: hypothetical protein FJ164_14480 [Gammaproteobacteria bacterium]|nr:hypothetical protein [Gammaproteobacteria bacterium]